MVFSFTITFTTFYGSLIFLNTVIYIVIHLLFCHCALIFIVFLLLPPCFFYHLKQYFASCHIEVSFLFEYLHSFVCLLPVVYLPVFDFNMSSLSDYFYKNVSWTMFQLVYVLLMI